MNQPKFDHISIKTTDARVEKPAVVMDAVDSSVGDVGVYMGTTTFSEVKDPIISWGYNIGGTAPNQRRLYWAIEGNFFDEGSGKTWAETYLVRTDSDGRNYRPFSVGTHDGKAEAAFHVDAFFINLANGQGDFTGAMFFAAGDPHTVGIDKKTVLLIRRGEGDYTPVVDVRDHQNARRMYIDADGAIRKTAGGTIMAGTDADDETVFALLSGRKSTSTPTRIVGWCGTVVETQTPGCSAARVRAAASQTAPILTVEDVNGSALAAFDCDGTLRLAPVAQAPSAPASGVRLFCDVDGNGKRRVSAMFPTGAPVVLGVEP